MPFIRRKTVRCALPSCIRNSTDVGKFGEASFFRFPKDDAIKKQWIDFVNVPGFVPKLKDQICMSHFARDAFLRDPAVLISIGMSGAYKPRLNRSAVPTIRNPITYEFGSFLAFRPASPVISVKSEQPSEVGNGEDTKIEEETGTSSALHTMFHTYSSTLNSRQTYLTEDSGVLTNNNTSTGSHIPVSTYNRVKVNKVNIKNFGTDINLSRPIERPAFGSKELFPYQGSLSGTNSTVDMKFGLPNPVFSDSEQGSVISTSTVPPAKLNIDSPVIGDDQLYLAEHSAVDVSPQTFIVLVPTPAPDPEFKNNEENRVELVKGKMDASNTLQCSSNEYIQSGQEFLTETAKQKFLNTSPGSLETTNSIPCSEFPLSNKADEVKLGDCEVEDKQVPTEIKEELEWDVPQSVPALKPNVSDKVGLSVDPGIKYLPTGNPDISNSTSVRSDTKPEDSECKYLTSITHTTNSSDYTPTSVPSDVTKKTLSDTIRKHFETVFLDDTGGHCTSVPSNVSNKGLLTSSAKFSSALLPKNSDNVVSIPNFKHYAPVQPDISNKESSSTDITYKYFYCQYPNANGASASLPHNDGVVIPSEPSVMSMDDVSDIPDDVSSCAEPDSEVERMMSRSPRYRIEMDELSTDDSSDPEFIPDFLLDELPNKKKKKKKKPADSDYEPDDASLKSSESKDEDISELEEDCEEDDGLKKIEPTEFVCKTCSRPFKNKSALACHTRAHVRVKKYECETCQKLCSTLLNLKRHQENMHMRDRTHPCKDCGRVFKSSNALARHSLVHTRKKPYLCEICARSFSQGTNLKTHIRTHTDERPFECKLCPEKFRNASGLAAHKYTHTGEKPHKCPFCEKQFVQLSVLKIHLRVHTNEKPFICKVCTKSFKCKPTFKKHLRTCRRR